MNLSIFDNDLPEIISSTETSNLHYTKDDVIISKVQREERLKDLELATVLGNTEHLKVQLFAEAIQGLVKIVARVTSTTDKHVLLVGGCLVPISAIHCVIFS